MVEREHTHSERVEQYQAVHEELLDLFARKNADYGDTFAIHGPAGVLMRINDKLQRCMHVSRTGIRLVNTERLRDTAADLANYAIMLIMLLDEGGVSGER